MMMNSDSGYVELYDIKVDPLEKKEISNQNPDIIKNLLKLIADWKGTLPKKPTGNIFSKERNRPVKNTKLN